MIKLVGLFKIKPGMSPEDFRDYYENNHVPLIQSLMPQIREYRRNYVVPGSLFVAGHLGTTPPAAPCDVITECWFEDRAAYDEMCALTADPAIGGRIAEDEAKFFDRDHMTMFLVDEHGAIIA